MNSFAYGSIVAYHSWLLIALMTESQLLSVSKAMRPLKICSLTRVRSVIW